MERFFTALSAGNATTMVLVTTELLGFYTISTMLLLRCCSEQRRSAPDTRRLDQYLELGLCNSCAANPHGPSCCPPRVQAGPPSCNSCAGPLMPPSRCHTPLPCRRQLPFKYRAIISDAIGGEMEFDMLHRWFNSTFLASASASLALFYGLLRQKRQEASDRLPLYVTPGLGSPSHARLW